MKRIRSFFSFFIIFLLLFVYFVNQNPHYHSAHTEQDHEKVEIPEGYAVPAVKTIVTKDPSGTWLLKVETKDFTFAPEKVGLKHPSYNEGHAHLYINEEKITRLYGNYYNLGTLKQGKNTIKVSLHSNNHGALVYKEQAIEHSKVVEVTS